ncbi:MAG: RluA family pseudouridine synthase [Myxococcota bacterium]
MLYRDLDIDERGAGWRVDVYLSARFSSFSRTRIARHIRAGDVLRNGAGTKCAARLADGDRLRIFIPGIAPLTPPPPLPEILYEDAQLLVFSKPSGLLVHPAGERFAWGLIGLARTARPDVRLDLVHRLDRETSGVLILTKDLGANVVMKEHFRARRVEKTYLALVRGVPDWSLREVHAPLGDADSEINLRRGVVADGQHAHTTFAMLQPLDGHALVSCLLHTGRTHQIRAHLEHLGSPLLGDKIYGQPDEIFLRWLSGERSAVLRETLGFSRQALHAWRLSFPHPVTRELCTVEAPMPADMRAVVDGESPAWPSPDAQQGQGDVTMG